MDLKYSANIGFLWEGLPLAERIAAAAKAGFDGVECHFPYDYAASDIALTLERHQIPMIGLNTLLGPPGEGYFGVAAIAGKEDLARNYIDQALVYAVSVGASHVNVVAGAGNNTSETVFRENLRYACKQASVSGITIVIEPLNPRSVANYHFCRVEQAVSTIDSVAEGNLKLMFDCFHTQIVQGDLTMLLQKYQQYIGHIQISAVHDRGEPDEGEVNYPFVLDMLDKSGYTGFIGAEYKPRGKSVESGLDWLDRFRQI